MPPEEVKKQQGFTKRVRGQVTIYIGTALGLVAGLAWNDAIKALIDSIYPADGGIVAKFIYAIIVTFIVVLATVYLLRKDDQ